jgi:hypothetical protein
MKKVKHKFKYSKPNMHTDWFHSISFRLTWRNSEYGEFIALTQDDFENKFYAYMRLLVFKKQRMIENMNFVENNDG